MIFPTLHQLEIFVTVARRGSFARAAEELFLSAPSVTLQVQRLEQHYRTRLFDRTSRGATLTEAGSILFDTTEALFAELEEAARAMKRTTASAHYWLSVGGTMLVGIYHLPLVIAIFRRRFPQVEVNLLVANREQIEDALLHQTIEVAVMGRDARSPHLRAEPFTLEPLELLAHAENPIAGRSPVPVEALADQTLLMREPGSLTRAALEEAMAARRLRFRAVVGVEGIEGLIRGVAENRGIGFGPAACGEIERRLGQIVIVSIADFSIEVPFYLVYRANQPLSESAQAFLQCCREVLS